MNPTPRTDAHESQMESEDFDVELAKTYRFARTLENELARAEELLREIRDDEVNAQDEADRFLCDHQPSQLSKLRADNAELLERLQDRTHSHTLASMRDVQTIQRQAVEIDALKEEIKVLSSGADKS